MRSLPRVTQLCLTVIVCSLVLLAASCFDVPLGDPATSKVDQRLVGYWHQEADDDSGTVIAVAAFDERAYLVSFHPYTKAGEQLTAGTQSSHKAWLTQVGQTPFITLLPMNEMPGLDDDQKPAYVVAKLDIQADRIIAHGLKPDAEAFKNLADADAFAKAIEANLNDAAIYEGEPITYRKLSRDNAEGRRLIEFARNGAGGQ